MTPNPHPAHHGPYTELTADAARDLRRPISPDEVRFKVQAVRWNKRDGQEKVATAAQVVAYIDARTVVARLNLLFPGTWKAPTDALPLEMRLTRRNADGTLTPIRVTDQGEVKADDTLYYRCRLAIADAAFEDVGAGDDPKAAYSDAIKRVAVRAGIGESLYAMDSPWLRVGDAEHQLRVSRAGKPYLDERTIRWLRSMYEAWLMRAGAIFGEPFPHAPAPTLPGAPDAPADLAPAAQTGDAPAPGTGAGNLAAVSAPEIPDIPGAPDPEPCAEGAPSATADGDAGAPPDEPHVNDAVRQMIAAAHATGVTAKTLKRLAVLLAARKPDTVPKLEDLDDKLAAELARRRAGPQRRLGRRHARRDGREGAALRAPQHPRAATQGVPRPPRPARNRGAGARRTGRRARSGVIADAREETPLAGHPHTQRPSETLAAGSHRDGVESFSDMVTRTAARSVANSRRWPARRAACRSSISTWLKIASSGSRCSSCSRTAQRSGGAAGFRMRRSPPWPASRPSW